MESILISRVKDLARDILSPGGTALHFGWNSTGLGLKHHMEMIELMLVCHGGSHNDTICMAERRNGAQEVML